VFSTEKAWYRGYEEWDCILDNIEQTDCCWIWLAKLSRAPNRVIGWAVHGCCDPVQTQVTWLASSVCEAQARVCLPVHGAPGECYYNTLLCCDYFHRRMWYRALSLRYVRIRSLGIILTHRLVCAKICFFRGLHCWARNRVPYSITHPAYLMPRELKRLRFRINMSWINQSIPGLDRASVSELSLHVA